MVYYGKKEKADRKCPERKRIMKTVNFAYYLKSERYSKALFIEEEQSLDFMRSYKVRKKQMTVCDIEECRG